tara:strand:- start:6385 stop:7506 length:1122 start_codon:yes stop_codon:yes gene_type:complete
MGKKLDEEIEHLKQTTHPIRAPARSRIPKYTDLNDSKARRNVRVQEALDGLERVRLRNADLFDDPDEDKAESEEEPLHELTDGELKEVEKLKSWEIWLEKALSGDSDHIRAPRVYEEGKAPHEMSTVSTGFSKRGKFGNKLTEEPKKEAERGAKTTQTGRSVSQHLKPESVKHLPKGIELQYLKDPEHEHEGAGSTRKIPKTQEELDQDFFNREAEEFKKRKKKSWEIWLGKAKEVKLTEEGRKILEEAKARIKDEQKLGTREIQAMYKSWLEKRKMPKKDRPESPNKENNYQTQLDKPIQWRALKDKTWEKWLKTKDQGQGDAKYGNPHETGMEDPRVLQTSRDDFSLEEPEEEGNKPYIERKRESDKDEQS